jgi:predicted RNA-binding protein with PUA-like domain
MIADGRTHWDGVRNYQAANNLKAMQLGDRAFFYHSNEGKEVIGIIEIVKEAYPDHTDPSARFVMVDVKAVKALPLPVTLRQIKADPALSGMGLLKQSRLSVQPVTPQQWHHICCLGGLEPATRIKKS